MEYFKKSFKTALVVLAGAMSLVAVEAKALVIDFDDVSNYGLLANSYTDNGFKITNTTGWLGAWGTNSPRQADQDGTAIFGAGFSNPIISLFRTDHALFDFTSISLGGLNNDLFGLDSKETVTFSFFDAMGNLFETKSVKTDGKSGLDVFSFNETGLSKVTFTTKGWFGNPVQFDDIGVSLSAVSPVPEPETYAMMLAGLGLIGFAARRKKL